VASEDEKERFADGRRLTEWSVNRTSGLAQTQARQRFGASAGSLPTAGAT
jgi:hypothetical protein